MTTHVRSFETHLYLEYKNKKLSFMIKILIKRITIQFPCSQNKVIIKTTIKIPFKNNLNIPVTLHCYNACTHIAKTYTYTLI